MHDLQPKILTTSTTIPHHLESASLKLLACAVFTQAIKDAGLCHYRHKRTTARKADVRHEAILFLTNGDPGFRFWCRALNQNPERVQAVMRRQLIRG